MIEGTAGIMLEGCCMMFMGNDVKFRVGWNIGYIVRDVRK